jgi:hypothetical protein
MHPLPEPAETTITVGAYVARFRWPLSQPRTGAAVLRSRWHPHLPATLAPAEVAQYQAGLDALLREAERQGLRVVVL